MGTTLAEAVNDHMLFDVSDLGDMVWDNWKVYMGEGLHQFYTKLLPEEPEILITELLLDIRQQIDIGKLEIGVLRMLPVLIEQVPDFIVLVITPEKQILIVGCTDEEVEKYVGGDGN